MKNDCITELEGEEPVAAFGVLDMMNFSFSSILRCKHLTCQVFISLNFRRGAYKPVFPMAS